MKSVCNSNKDTLSVCLAIGEIANRVVRSGNVTNQLEVKPTTTTTTRIE